MRRLAWLVVAAFALLLGPPAARAELPACAADPLAPLSKPSAIYSVTLDWATAMAPLGGIVRFNLKGMPKPAEMQVCLRWKPSDAVLRAAPAEIARLTEEKAAADTALTAAEKALAEAKAAAPATATEAQRRALAIAEQARNAAKHQTDVAAAALATARLPWTPARGLRLEQAGTDANTYTFEVPDGDNVDPRQFPLLEYRILAANAANVVVDVVQDIRITYPPVAFLFTALVLAVVLLGLYKVGTLSGIPGGDIFIKIITDRDGYASLSQAQVMLWTFVIGGAATYVLLLSGSLVNISEKVLYLMGFSGAALVGAKLLDAQKAPAALANVPGVVTDLQIEADGEVVPGTLSGMAALLTWRPPAGDLRGVSYVVRAKNSKGTQVVTDSLTRPALRITGPGAAGLRGETWTFEVACVNAAGQSAYTATTTPFVGLALETAGATATPAGLKAETVPGAPSIRLTWKGLPDLEGWEVVWRPRASDADWQSSGTLGGGVTAYSIDRGLLGGWHYDVLLRAIGAGGVRSLPVAATAAAGPRQPRWADLVIFDEATGEINVTRVQMLFFTLVIAGYVILGVFRTQVIQDIPDSILLLMGISNGVYLSAKLTPRR